MTASSSSAQGIDGARPGPSRRFTEPAMGTVSVSASDSGQGTAPPSHDYKNLNIPLRPRNVITPSLFSRSHHRSRSAVGLPTAPTMMRTQSMPLKDANNRMLMSTVSARPASPLNSGRRFASPSRRSSEDPLPGFGRLPGVDEDAEASTGGASGNFRNTHGFPASPSFPLQPGNTFPRRHRPTSPLRPLPHPTAFGTSQSMTQSIPRSSSPSPLLSASKFNEAFPVTFGYQASFSSNSSLPSTPTSTRSRSPSISSLETIPDSPGAEEAALEAERIAQLKAAADAADAGELGMFPERQRQAGSLGLGAGLTASYGGRDKKKRWSVCGAERRGDLNLDTIWED